MVINPPAAAAVDSVLELLKLLSDPVRATKLVEEIKQQSVELAAVAAEAASQSKALKEQEQSLSVAVAERNDFSAGLARLALDRTALNEAARLVAKREKELAVLQDSMSARELEFTVAHDAQTAAVVERENQAALAIEAANAERESFEQKRKALIAAVGD